MPVYQLFVGFLLLSLFGFGGVLLMLRRGRKWPRLLAGVLFLILGGLVLDVYLQAEGIYLSYPSTAYLLNLGVLLLGPLLYFLTRSTLYQDFDWRRIDVLHLIPYGVAFLSTILGYHLKSQTEKLAWLNGLADAEAAENLAVSLVVLVGIGAYLFAAFRHLRRYRERLQEDYAELERKNLGWLRRLLLTFAGLSVLSVLSQVLNFIDGESQWMMLSLLLTVLFLVGQILYTVYIGMRESLLFGGISEATTDRETTPQAKLPEGVAVRRAERIKDYFATDHPYLDPELSLASLAAALDLPEREVSQSINGVLGQHFFDLVNAYRIDHACALLDNPKDKGETILEVMYASGFQSKSSFNTEFRRRTGMTPSGWKKRGSVVGN